MNAELAEEREVFLQALRNLWPLLSPTGRQQAIQAAAEAQ